MKSTIRSTAILFLFILGIAVYAQKSTTHFHYLSPQPGSKYVLPQNNIVLREGEVFKSFNKADIQLEVNGSVRGEIQGQLVSSDDNRSLIFKPNEDFAWGEVIQVEYTGGLKTLSGKIIDPVQFSFTVSPGIPEKSINMQFGQEVNRELANRQQSVVSYQPRNKTKKVNDLPDDYPEITINVSNNPPTDSYYFISSFGYWGWFPDAIPYLSILDAQGTPVFYQRLDGHSYDFKLQPDGHLSYYYNLWPNPYIIICDSAYHHIDTYTMQNGYSTDFHEFILLPNHHAILQGFDVQFVDMSQVVPGGDPNAQVAGWIIQELDSNKNVIFQWRSWDHYEITDADEHVDLTASSFDYTHGNSIDVIDDGSLLLSARNFNEMTKIDRNTGDIIWRLGGKNNMFEFINDTLHFSRAHHGRILENGNLSMFDNGTYHPDSTFSSTLEYSLDETNLTATLLHRFRNNPDILGVIMGSAHHQKDGHIVTGWGSGVPGITEFDEEGNTVLEMYFAGINYRAYRFPWSTNAFSLSDDTLNYGYTWYQDPVVKKIQVNNPGENERILTSAFVSSDAFVVDTPFPLSIPGGGSALIQISFVPQQAGYFEDVVTINSDINNEVLVQRIAQQVRVMGHATEGQSVNEQIPGLIGFYPNPVRDFLTLDFKPGTQELKLVLYNAEGQTVQQRTFKHPGKENIDMSTLPPGIYFLTSTDRVSGKTAHIKLIKK